ncbi:MAG: S41 family peptidase [Betaproteobacteria bacterium]
MAPLLVFALGFLCAAAQAQPGTSLTAAQYTEDFDHLWTRLGANYAYFDGKDTDWARVRATYRPRIAAIDSRNEFIELLERVLDELYDPHTHLKTNTERSTRLIPTGLDVWAEWRDGKAVITQLRDGFSAQQAGLAAGMEIVAINGTPVAAAVGERLPVASKTSSEAAGNWALLALLAGTHEKPRVIEARSAGGGSVATYRLDQPGHLTADRYRADLKVESKRLEDNLGYIRINDLGSDVTVAAFDAALERLRSTRGLVIDLRATQGGGDTAVAEPIMGRLIARRMAYQRGKPVHGRLWIREVSPRGRWTYAAPVVVLVGRWTASMGEGMAIGLDAMGRATVVGTRMAGLNGAVSDLRLPNTGIRVNYAAEKLFHLNGMPREAFVPPLLVDPASGVDVDAILAAGIETLRNSAGRKQSP